MPRIVLMHLTEVSTVPNEDGQKKIERTQDAQKPGNLKKDDYGRTAEDYENMNLRVPVELIAEKEEGIDEHGMVSLNDDEVEYEFFDCIISLGEFMTAIDHPQIGSVVFTKQNFSIHVSESAEEVHFLIYYLQRGRWQRFKDGMRAIRNWAFPNKKKTIKL